MILRQRRATRRLELLPVSAVMAESLIAGTWAAFDPALHAGRGWPTADTIEILRRDSDSRDLYGHNAPIGDDTVLWLIVLRHSGEIIGDCGTHGVPDPNAPVEIGYGLAARYRGCGYGTEAVASLVDWLLFDVGCPAVAADVNRPNMASRRLLEQLGFFVVRHDAGSMRYQRSAIHARQHDGGCG
jgi:RimJ/RimL family protein N-acetyltransferase